ncbi:anterior gradient 1 [Denticeps clupeoides]|uniref:Uncharacterized protein n=1 Tax=Denticeps clupeoides TaxID=299321 RepID=A0AAY4CJC0_9TELE|nr:anterior gradient protein 3-like [Denticeps clupeoides]
MLHWSHYIFILLVLFDVSSSQRKSQKKSLSRGWGDGIVWVPSYMEGLEKMKESNKPLMVIHHLDNCPFSQELKKAFVEYKDIQEMAKADFIMFNTLNETTDKNLAPDGYYVPRILFIDPSMTVRADIVSRYSNRLYAYEPNDMELLLSNMKKAKLLLHNEL